MQVMKSNGDSNERGYEGMYVFMGECRVRIIWRVLLLEEESEVKNEKWNSKAKDGQCCKRWSWYSGFNSSSNFKLGWAPSGAKVRRALSFNSTVCVCVCLCGVVEGRVQAEGIDMCAKANIYVCVCILVAVVTVTDSNNGNRSKFVL